MKRVLLSLLIFFTYFPSLHAQQSNQGPNKRPKDKPAKPLSEKLYFGGGLGASFGTYTRLALYPLVGIRHSEKFRTGVQLGYEYINDKRYFPSYEASNYGMSLFAEYNIIPQIYLHAEPALYNYQSYYLTDKDRVWVPFFYVGGGVAQPVGGNSFMYVQVKFDLIQDINSPYASWAPFYDVGIRVGL